MKSKRGQITILVILALIIVVSIVLVVTVVKKPTVTVTSFENPGAYISECVEKSLEKNVNYLISVNGYPNLNDTGNYINYRGENIPYLCTSGQFYVSCINQEPLLIEHFRKQIQEKSEREIKGCFSQLIDSYRDKGYTVTEDKNEDYSVVFEGDAIAVEINKKITLKKGEETKSYNKFSGEIISPLYRLVDVARYIVNFESTICNFDYINWEMYYRNVDIKRDRTGDQSKIYTVIDLETNKTIKFAVKTCVLPAGI